LCFCAPDTDDGSLLTAIFDDNSISNVVVIEFIY